LKEDPEISKQKKRRKKREEKGRKHRAAFKAPTDPDSSGSKEKDESA